MMPGSDVPYFKYARAASTIRVDHVPKGGGREIVDLFKSVIGPIRNVDFRGDGTSVEITFCNPDDTIKSLCLSGYAVSGHPIVVTLKLPSKPRVAIPAKFPDNRRNLYVLGLPFDLTENELLSIFSRFGTVTHSVILATVDNASRRRGFVVMSTNAEAKAAMDNISQTSVRGSIIDVSWAVVQRSQGFLDGGDRAVALEGQVDSASTSADRGTTLFKPFGAFSDSSKIINSLPGAQPYPTSIIVHNLPSVLFARDSDLEPLFFPFGEVKEIRKQGPSAAQSRADTISVLVTYSSVTGAREAKVALHGQTYGDIPLIVEPFPPCHNHDFNRRPGREHLSRSSLNPRALRSSFKRL
ncbi:hypothetical protein BC827DRAFT_387058 [Russula dissimulans]|nr:hypothetical protein BC827DRAFT_387058 [Russula dissimulans]